MTTVRFKYGLTAKPVANDCNGGELGAVNWISGGNHTVTRETTQPHSGKYDLKVVATANGDFVTNFAKLPAASGAVLVVGQAYEIAFWVYSVNGKPVKVSIGGFQSGDLTTVAGVYTCVAFAFTPNTANTDLLILSDNAGLGDTFYLDDLTIMQYTDFTAVSVYGIDWPDKVVPVGQINDYTDGSSETQFIGTYIRHGEIRLKVFQDLASAKTLLSWINDNNRMIDYLTENSIPIVPESLNEFTTNWLGGAKVGRQYAFKVKEGLPRSSWPV